MVPMNEAAPLVSIGVPVYNGEAYLRRALESLAAQDYPSWEMIISDNASTDSTETICREFAERDERVRYVRNETNVGILPNFDIVLRAARGPYFMWAAFDDYWEPRFVSACVRELEDHPEAGVAMSAVERRTERGDLRDVIRHVGRRDPNRMSRSRLAWHLASGRLYHLYFYGLYRTELARHLFAGFPRVKAGDRIFMIHAALARPFRYVDEVLHVRQVSDLAIEEKYVNEEFGRFWKDPLSTPKMLLAAARNLLGSDLIGFGQKTLVPVLLARLLVHFWWIALLSRAYVWSGRMLGNERRRAIGNVLRRMSGRRQKPIADSNGEER